MNFTLPLRKRTKVDTFRHYMFSFLKKHPFGVEAFFESSLVLTYAVAKEELEGMLPPCLSPDTYDDKWAFIAVAMVKTRNLRPKGFPEFMGNDFMLIGYRIFVKYVTNVGKRLRGLYIIKSETDSEKMRILGSLFTHYNYAVTDILHTRNGAHVSISSRQSALKIEVELGGAEVSLPVGSPFSDWKAARRYAGPLPFTFTYDVITKEVLIIEGMREHWEPRPVSVTESHVGFIEHSGYKDILLASAFIVQNIPYHWKKGRTEIWNG